MGGRTKKGFTLIELIIVLVIVGILAAVAVPKFADLGNRAKFAAIKGTVGNVRSALSVAKANNLINASNTANAYWPYLTQLDESTSASTIGNDSCPLDSVMPENPFFTANGNLVEAATGAEAAARTADGTGAGWRYYEGSGIFYANTSSPSDGTNTPNEY